MKRADVDIRDATPLRGAGRAAGAALVIGLIGLGAGVWAGYAQGDWAVFFRSYLLNYAFVLSLALGALFFVLLQHLTRAGWSVAVRRLAEFIAGSLPLLFLLFLPLLIPALRGMRGVWSWTDEGVVFGDPLRDLAPDAVLIAKHAYLNVPFFLARCAVYFGIWITLAGYFGRQSLRQDATGDPQLTLAMQWWSAPGMLLFGLTTTFFAFDALMSLNPHWFSTIFGVYFFSGSAVGFFALLALVMGGVQAAGGLRESLTREHYHDVGKLAFGFVVFWAYIAFSQYMLIWYANIPEEAAFYWPRQGDHWWIGVSLLLLFGHFFAPFLALISRIPKRRPGLLSLAAVWLLAMHWLDLYWLVAPRPDASAAGVPLHATDGALLVGLGGLFAFAILRPMARRPLLPARDPRLAESLTFENV
jgi:hypothetical protein